MAIWRVVGWVRGRFNYRLKSAISQAVPGASREQKTFESVKLLGMMNVADSQGYDSTEEEAIKFTIKFYNPEWISKPGRGWLEN